jgi:hypothetical protein
VEFTLSVAEGLLAMTQGAFLGHCERLFEESRGNLKTFILNFGDKPLSQE